MKPTLSLPLAIAVAALAAAGFLFAPAVFAHAAITSLAWDNPASPTRLIGSTAGDEISSAPGDFALKVYNSSGIQVDSGDARISAPFTAISVGVPAGLPSGTYRVEWTVTSEDGHRESGSLSISLTPGSTVTPAATAAATMTHSGGATVEADDHDADDHSPASMEKVTLELKLTGAAEVPPVRSAASAFARLVFDPATSELSYAITLSGVAPGTVTGLHVHRGGPTENGPHVFDIINAPFMTVSGKTILSASAVNDLYAGNLYLRLHTQDFPSGAARAQIVMPKVEAAHAVSPTASVRPPSTGEAGLAAASDSASLPILALAVLAGALMLTAAGVRFATAKV